MCKCGKKTCNSCGSKKSSTGPNGSASMATQVALLQEQFNKIEESTKFLTCGHPILLIENQSDLDAFDFMTGLGSDCWEGFALCDGKEHISKTTKKKITTPNFVDRFIVHAGGNYNVGDTGGSNSVSLTTNQLASHSHTITDAGHSHTITDAGHDHSVQEDPHTHNVSFGAHSHELQIDGVGDHSHSTGFTLITDGGGGGTAVKRANSDPGSSASPGGAHTHTGTALPSGGGVGTCSGESTGVQVLTRTTGISVNNANSNISVNNQGNGDAHENRPPYYAALYVMKIW